MQQPGGPGTAYNVFGSHTYAVGNVYAVTATITDQGSSGTTVLDGVTFNTSDFGSSKVIFPDTADVRVAQFQTAPIAVAAVERVGFTAPLAEFSYANARNPNPTFTATIDWGDGTAPTPGTITFQPGGTLPFLVTGSHTYAQRTRAGQPPYPITVTIQDNQGAAVKVATSATVARNLTVTTAADDGSPGSLRSVINELNDGGPGGTITFDIPGAGVHTIAVQSPLPPVEFPVTIDGSTQPGFAGTPLIEVNGSSISPAVSSSADGLELDAGNSAIRDLAIDGFSGVGVVLAENGGDALEDDSIGINPQGTAAVPNYQGVLILGTSNNVLGGDVISGNSAAGVQIFNAATIPGSGFTGAATGNVVQADLIGTDATGTRAVPNGQGIFINDASGNVIGGTARAGNVISGNATVGVQILGDNATGNVVDGNVIGTDRRARPAARRRHRRVRLREGGQRGQPDEDDLRQHLRLQRDQRLDPPPVRRPDGGEGRAQPRPRRHDRGHLDRLHDLPQPRAPRRRPATPSPRSAGRRSPSRPRMTRSTGSPTWSWPRRSRPPRRSSS